MIRNPGNILPFYTDKDFQRHRLEGQNAMPFGLIAHKTRLIPFQMYVPTGTISAATLTAFNAADETISMDITSAVLDIANRTGGGGWVTFLDQGISEDVPCGYWYLRLSLGFAGTYYSEVLWLRNFPEVPELSRLRWTSATDKGTVLYQNGYEQYLNTEPGVTWDIPEVDETRDVLDNGYGETVDTYTRIAERIKFEVKDVPDYALATLDAMGANDTVMLELARYSLLVTTQTLEEVQFSSRRQSKELSTGIFTANGRAEIFTGCQPNFELE